jgi:hypothetical protein
MRVVFVAIALSFVAACVDPAPPGKSKAVFTDLPAPEGCTYVEGFGLEEQAFRTYTQKYEISRRLDDMTKWYKDAFKVHGWVLKGESPGNLAFTKKEEKVVVALAEDPRAGLKIEVKVSKKDD